MNENQTERERLEARLRELQAEEAAAKKAKAAAVKTRFLFTVSLVEDSWTTVLDDTCCVYLIDGKILNKEELASVGKSSTFEGGMKFYFNKVTGRLIGHTGGGTTYVGRGENERACYDEVSAFLVRHPSGGDITEIMNKYREGF